MIDSKNHTVHDFPLEATYSNLEKKIVNSNVDLLSIDIFDTILIRKESNEDKRFRNVSEISSKAINIDAELIFQARKFAHKSAYSINLNGESEARFSDILKMIVNLLGLEDNVLEVLRKIEIDYEYNSLKVNKELVKLLQKTRVPYLFASDMYLEIGDIEDLFDKFKIQLKPIEILVSSSLGLSKRNHGMFRYIKEKFKDKKNLMQIGDNRYSDIINAEKHGMHSFWIRHTHAK